MTLGKDTKTSQRLSLVHDLRQPLSAVKLWAQLLSGSIRDDLPEREKSYLDKLEGEILRLERVLEAAAAEPDRMPAMELPGRDARDRVILDPGQPLAAASVLIVDDDVLTAEALQVALEDAGAIVRTAEDIAAALDLHETDPAHVIVSDLSLQGESGVDLLRAIRARDADAERRTGVIALSGFVDMYAADDPSHSGFDDRLAKPIAIDVLVESIRALLARSPS